MQRWLGVLVAAGISALSITTVLGMSPEDGKAAFERREDTMKRMGRPFYLGIGRVVKGSATYGPDTVTAAKTVGELASALDRSLFPPGSDVAESRIKPEIFAAMDQVDQLIAAVQAATAQLVPAVRTIPSSAANTWCGRAAASPATPPPMGQSWPEAERSPRRSGRSTARTSRPTRKLGSDGGPTRSFCWHCERA